jgi:hypothetical protein
MVFVNTKDGYLCAAQSRHAPLDNVAQRLSCCDPYDGALDKALYCLLTYGAVMS